MKRFYGLLRETWWLWLVLYGGCYLLATYVEPFMVVTYPMMFVVFVYFAFVRFDDEGESRH
jgi:hypothetical protein